MKDPLTAKDVNGKLLCIKVNNSLPLASFTISQSKCILVSQILLQVAKYVKCWFVGLPIKWLTQNNDLNFVTNYLTNKLDFLKF